MNAVTVRVGDDQGEAFLSAAEIVRQSFALAAKAHREGRVEEAERLYRAILTCQPMHADSLHGLGVLAHQAGQTDLAAQLIGDALAQRVEPTFHNNLGLVFLALDRPHEALASVRRALELRPAYPEAFNALGNVQQKLRLREEAISSYEKAVSLRGDYADAYGNLAKALLEKSDGDAAMAACETALELNPSCAESQNTMGNILRAKGRFDEALEHYDLALECRPCYAEAFNNKASLLLVMKKNDEAMVAARCALACRPEFPAALTTYGSILVVEGKLDEALPYFEKSAALDPCFIEAHNNLGAALLQLDRTDEAIAAYERAIDLSEEEARAPSHFNLATTLLGGNSVDKAIASFNKALTANPNFLAAHNNLGVALQNKGLANEALAAYGKVIDMDPQYAAAYCNKLMAMQYAERYTNDDVFEAARAFGDVFDHPDPGLAERNDLSSGRRLRIGYVSGDFNAHPVGFFTIGSLSVHDRSQFEIFCYYNCTSEDSITEAFRGIADHWHSIIGKSDSETAKLIHDDGIDILVDLAGHTNKTRVALFGLKPAPVQVHWVGYTGTTGLPSIDYLILDPISAPPGSDRWYTESLVRLPYGRFCYKPMAPDIAIADPPSLSGKPVTFGCFNNITKLAPSVIRLWSQLLNDVPGSRLLLKSKSLTEASVRASLLKTFMEHGLDSQRIELRGASGYLEMLRQYNDVDIALDPFPFGGATTSCDAFWMGVPVITLPSDRLASRQTLAFLHYMGHEELASSSPEDYVARAAALAADPVRLKELRNGLRSALLAAPFSDGSKFTAALEQAYRTMWRRYVAGEKPGPLDIPAN